MVIDNILELNLAYILSVLLFSFFLREEFTPPQSLHNYLANTHKSVHSCSFYNSKANGSGCSAVKTISGSSLGKQQVAHERFECLCVCVGHSAFMHKIMNTCGQKSRNKM